MATKDNLNQPNVEEEHTSNEQGSKKHERTYRGDSAAAAPSTAPLVLLIIIMGIAIETGITLWGIPEKDYAELGIADFSEYPPWHVLWPPFFMDIGCHRLGCQWRNYISFGQLTQPGGWWSVEYGIVGLARLLPRPLTFEQFREMQGYNVAPGTGWLAGLDSTTDLNDWHQSLYEYMFDTPSTSLANLTTPTALGILFLLVLCIKAFKAVLMPPFEKLGQHLALQTHGRAWLDDKNQERITKFAECVYRLCYHSFISLVGCYLFWNAPWWDEAQGGTRNLYTDWPNDPVQPSMAWYYLVQAAYNVDAMVCLLQISFQVKVFSKDSSLPVTVGWAGTVRGDFNEMATHHMVTNVLVFLSSYLCQTRVGSMVFWMHDISNVPVDLVKLANFVKWRTGTIFFFFTMCIFWFYTRICVLPFTIWPSIFFHSQEVGRGFPELWFYFYAYQPLFVSLLAALILLHAVWFSIFIRMGFLLVSKGETHYITEHKKGEKQSSAKQKTNGVTALNRKVKTK